MISLHVTLTVRNQSDITAVRGSLGEHARLSRAEPGCLRFEAYQSELDSHVFYLLEAWDSQAALDAHREAEAFTTVYGPKVLPLVERAVHQVTPIID